MTRQIDEDRPLESQNAADAEAWMRCARLGDLDGAWAASDRIRQRSPRTPNHQGPRHFQRIWKGTPLDNRRVLVRCYHGLGDTIQFIRYVPLVRNIASEVVVWAQADLLPLLECSFDGVTFLPLHDGTPDVEYDVDIEVMELPYAFRTTLATVPDQVPYLRTPPARLPDSGRPRVGIVWRAGDWDTRRSVPFSEIRRLLELPGVDWHRIQYGSRPEETNPHLSPFPNASITATAQHMRALDLVISVDTMPAHLAGALGIPVWTLLSDDADWR